MISFRFFFFLVSRFSPIATRASRKRCLLSFSRCIRVFHLLVSVSSLRPTPPSSSSVVLLPIVIVYVISTIFLFSLRSFQF